MNDSLIMNEWLVASGCWFYTHWKSLYIQYIFYLKHYSYDIIYAVCVNTPKCHFRRSFGALLHCKDGFNLIGNNPIITSYSNCINWINVKLQIKKDKYIKSSLGGLEIKLWKYCYDCIFFSVLLSWFHCVLEASVMLRLPWQSSGRSLVWARSARRRWSDTAPTPGTEPETRAAPSAASRPHCGERENCGAPCPQTAPRSAAPPTDRAASFTEYLHTSEHLRAQPNHDSLITFILNGQKKKK